MNKYLIFIVLAFVSFGCTKKIIQRSAIYNELQKNYSATKKDYEGMAKAYHLKKDTIKMLQQDFDQLRRQYNLLLEDSTMLVKNNYSDSSAHSVKNNNWELYGMNTDEAGNKSYRVCFKGNVYDIYIVENPKDIRMFWKDDKSTIGNIGNLKKKSKSNGHQLMFGMNAGIFKRDRVPEGLLVIDGQELIGLNEKKGQGNFYLKPNGIFLVEGNGNARVVETSQMKEMELEIEYATQSGPMLVIDGEIHEVFKPNSSHFNIRNGVGVNKEGKVIFAISNKRVTFHAFASLFKDLLQCENALYLDGSISQAYIPHLDRHGLSGQFGPLIGVYKEMDKKQVQKTN